MANAVRSFSAGDFDIPGWAGWPIEVGELLLMAMRLMSGLEELSLFFYIEDFQDIVNLATSQAARVTLPNLWYYEGPANFVLAMACGKLKEVRLSWEDDEPDIDDILLALKSLASPDFPPSSYHDYNWDRNRSSEILASISRILPQTKTLSFQPAPEGIIFYLGVVSLYHALATSLITQKSIGRDPLHHRMPSEVYGVGTLRAVMERRRLFVRRKA
ncbi:hypothetical protein DFH06DRAFT_137109 [Mycena polygramma]|nr:hypothetical protein DFH06DRAFT_137109 [Mycena polygramma]